jgi:hypothetical protein
VPILADRISLVSFSRACAKEFYRSNGLYKKSWTQVLKYYMMRKVMIYAGLLAL